MSTESHESQTLAAALPVPLDAVTLTAILRTTIDALPYHRSATADEKATEGHAALAFIAGLRPRDTVEAWLASRCVVANAHAMDSLRDAARRDIPLELQDRLRRRADRLCKLVDLTLEAIERRQSRSVAPPLQMPEAPAARAVPALPEQGGAEETEAPMREADAAATVPQAKAPAAPSGPVGVKRPEGRTPAEPPRATREQILAELARREAETSAVARAAA